MSSNQLKAVIETNKGTIRINLHSNETPLTVSNFVNLAKRQFYNGIKFHRVIGNFMIQAGCPFGNGTGGPGYQFEDEFKDNLKHDKPGILSMANAGPGTNGSQFFITHIPTPHLNNNHTVFGEVEGKEDLKVVNKIVQRDKIISITIEGDADALLEQTKDKVEAWNKALDKAFPDLKK
ncbi:MAG: peptidylprolyl isomerase [Proteobacteria bacterium]|nr:peptidylprolyl isomerase [Pseudomonadota bacterium]